jgi:cytochrome oxidase Cu insertion factor (SCO1/SenC/PrrC family)
MTALMISVLLVLPYAHGQKPGEAKTASHEQKMEVGYEAPGFTVNDLKGNSVKLSDYEGKVVILSFWNLW